MEASESAERLRLAAERLELASRNLATPNSGNQSTVTINAGGMAVWAATTACLVMLAVNVFLAALYLDQQRKIADLDAYLSAIYMQAPYLKPEGKK